MKEQQMQKKYRKTFLLHSQWNWLSDQVIEIKTIATFLKRTA